MKSQKPKKASIIKKSFTSQVSPNVSRVSNGNSFVGTITTKSSISPFSSQRGSVSIISQKRNSKVSEQKIAEFCNKTIKVPLNKDKAIEKSVQIRNPNQVNESSLLQNSLSNTLFNASQLSRVNDSVISTRPPKLGSAQALINTNSVILQDNQFEINTFGVVLRNTGMNSNCRPSSTQQFYKSIKEVIGNNRDLDVVLQKEENSEMENGLSQDIYQTNGVSCDDVADEVINSNEYQTFSQNLLKINEQKGFQNTFSPRQKAKIKSKIAQNKENNFKFFTPSANNYLEKNTTNTQGGISKNEGIVKTCQDFIMQSELAVNKMLSFKQNIVKKIEDQNSEYQTLHTDIVKVNKQNAEIIMQIDKYKTKNKLFKDQIDTITHAISDVYDKQQEKIDLYTKDIYSKQSNKKKMKKELETNQKCKIQRTRLTQNEQQQKQAIDYLEQQIDDKNAMISALKKKISTHKEQQMSLIKILGSSFKENLETRLGSPVSMLSNDLRKSQGSPLNFMSDARKSINFS
ncbi:UNKNOWN [Stylonychia lemnae]|uniref:Uncharacterized protein n=1 Tax=Stylonychia lemnae TaxID=5949 RepID=A0A078AAW8_STYLE|nr:UNKNOWN [Stylonychia lemnae]|eukprot:CDW78752.1 UNKNOWN [Stylonychia lemnae]